MISTQCTTGLVFVRAEQILTATTIAPELLYSRCRLNVSR